MGTDGQADGPRGVRAGCQGDHGRRDQGPRRPDPWSAGRHASIRCGAGSSFCTADGHTPRCRCSTCRSCPARLFAATPKQLGLRYQPWPPYYVLQTPSLDVDDIYALMEEAQEAFGVEFDALPPPRLDLLDERSVCRIDLDAEKGDGGRTAERSLARSGKKPSGTLLPPSPSLAFTLWLRSSDFHRRRREAAEQIDRLLTDNPHTTLQVVLEPTGDPDRLTVETLELLLATCYKTTTYLDRYYSLQPGRLLGSKRLVVLLPKESAAPAEQVLAPPTSPSTQRYFSSTNGDKLGK